MEKITGIYCITNEINGKIYVGLSKDCLRRWHEHYSLCLQSKKEREYRKALYQAMRKYGRENFSFKILEECDVSILREREVYWIEKLNSYNKGYNATKGGDYPEGYVLQGEEHGMHKLSEEDVIKCRDYYSQGLRSRDIWEKYYSETIDFSGFQAMWHGVNWKHVKPEVFDKKQHPRKKITNSEIIEIKKMYRENKSCAEIYHYFDHKFSRTTINDICNERRYKNIF